jgi:hypothetical protein
VSQLRQAAWNSRRFRRSIFWHKVGSVLVHVDCTVPVARVRDELTRIVSRSKLWDRQVVNLQVTDAREGTIVLRALMRAATASAVWDLRCEVREEIIAFLQRKYPQALPKPRAELTLRDGAREEPTGGAAEARRRRTDGRTFARAVVSTFLTPTRWRRRSPGQCRHRRR